MEKEKSSEFPYEAPRGKIWKTNSFSEWILVDNPDDYDLEGNQINRRSKPTNITLKKKKRKKKHKKR